MERKERIKLDFTFRTHHLDSAELTKTMMQIKLRPASPPAMSCHTFLLSFCAFTYMEVSSIRLSAGWLDVDPIDQRHFEDPVILPISLKFEIPHKRQAAYRTVQW